MKQTVQPIKRFKFGIFEADLRTGELTKLGKRVRLQEQPFQLLAMLLEKPGELVTREELRNRLWPKTIVEFDHGLNKAISKVREALGDSAENPRFIETVASRGYRFLADVVLVHGGQPETIAGDLARRETPVFRDRVTPASQQDGRPCLRLEAFRLRDSSDPCSLLIVDFLFVEAPPTLDPLLGSAAAAKPFERCVSGLFRRRNDRRVDHATGTDQRNTRDLPHVRDDL
jgi:DNA-binding winged helix-turn-helix (wHTH) protein